MDRLTKSMDTVSKVAKAYVGVSYIKTALTFLVIGYAALKVIKIFKV